ATEAFNLHMGDNVIYGAAVYPSLPAYEADVVAMGLELLDAPDGAGGTVTTGGTESICVAVKTARDWARDHKPGVVAPEIVVPRTAHVAFSKAAQLFGLKLVRMAGSVDYRADVAAMAAAINDNTLMIVGSAPPYPYANVDPIQDIAALAVEHGLWMHVDACVGGFVLPFARDLGYPVPDFDFAVPGVTSMSADLHKYGYALRGSSLLLLRDRALEEYQRFESGDWPAGTYATMGLAGSRNGGPVASAWAVMRYLGFNGYRERVAKILETKRYLIAGIQSISGLTVLGEPEGGHFAFMSTDQDTAAIAHAMTDRGWMLARGEDPAAIILLLNFRHGEVADDFLADLRGAVDDVASGRVEGPAEGAVYSV
ncbi:MAG: aminotransferase class V-fold PLP-dependent enzyme, partial [Alphaproteobacteria bacterium]